MPELLEGLAQLARERGTSLQRASQELAGEPEGFLIVARETCKFVGLLADIWAVMGMRLRRGGVSARRLLGECDKLLQMSEVPAHYLGLVVQVWPERELPPESAAGIYEEVQAAWKRLDSLREDLRQTRERAAAPPRLAAEPEEVKQRIEQADESGAWMSLANATSRLRQGSPPNKE